MSAQSEVDKWRIRMSEHSSDNDVHEHGGPASGNAMTAEAALHAADIGSGTFLESGLSRPDAPITIAGMSDALGTWEGDARAAAFEEQFSQPDTLQLVRHCGCRQK